MDDLNAILGGLGERKAAFVRHWLGDDELRISVAAQKTGISQEKARQWVRGADIRTAVSQIFQDRRQRFADLRDQALHNLAAIAFWDPIHLVDDSTGAVKRLNDLPREVRLAISGYRERADGTPEYKFADRVKVLELLMKHFGDLAERREDQPANSEGGVQIILRGVDEAGIRVRD